MARTTSNLSPDVGLLEACVDRRLLNLTLSPKQREFVSLIERYQTVIGAGGRQGGKSLLVAAALVHNLALCPHLDELASGMRYGLAIANSKEQAGIIVGHARRLIESSALLRSQLVSAQADRLILKDGRVLLAMPCVDRLQRGLTASMVALDELAHFVDSDGSPAQADRVYAAARPALVTFGELGRLVAISTPLGSDGLFATLHARAAAGELLGATAFTATTAEMNPRVSAEFLEGERIMLGEADFAREYLAEFTGGGAAFFESDALRAVMGRHRELSRDEGSAWIVGFDPAFSVDPAAAAVVGRSGSDRRQLVVARVERWLPGGKRKRLRRSTAATQRSVDIVLDGVAALSKSYGGAPVVTDQHLPASVIEGLKRREVPRVLVRSWTGQSQTDAFRGLRARIYAGSITLPDNEDLVAELLRITTKLQAGSSQVRIPRSGSSHCDLAVALAAAVLELDTHGIVRPGRTYSAVAGRRGRNPLRDQVILPARDGKLQLPESLR